MKGKYRVVVSTKRLKYDFELHRNLTIIQGDSATGKTTMIDMIIHLVLQLNLYAIRNVLSWKVLCGKNNCQE